MFNRETRKLRETGNSRAQRREAPDSKCEVFIRLGGRNSKLETPEGPQVSTTGKSPHSQGSEIPSCYSAEEADSESICSTACNFRDMAILR